MRQAEQAVIGETSFQCFQGPSKRAFARFLKLLYDQLEFPASFVEAHARPN